MGGWLTPRPGRFALGKDPVPIVQEAGWTPQPVWTGAENVNPTVIRSPDHPTRGESLYRMSYRGPPPHVMYLYLKECVCNGDNSGPLRLRYMSKVSLYLFVLSVYPSVRTRGSLSLSS